MSTETSILSVVLLSTIQLSSRKIGSAHIKYIQIHLTKFSYYRCSLNYISLYKMTIYLFTSHRIGILNYNVLYSMQINSKNRMHIYHKSLRKQSYTDSNT